MNILGTARLVIPLWRFVLHLGEIQLSTFEFHWLLENFRFDDLQAEYDPISERRPEIH
jgi:hypothetical protein